MISKMLISIDQTEASRNATLQGAMLARSEQSQVVIQAVIPAYEGDLNMMGRTRVLDEMKASYQTALKDASRIVKNMNLNTKSVLDEGKPFSRILDLAVQEKVDLIVLNHTQHFPIDRVPVGESIYTVIHQSQKDVLVVPPNASLGLDRILLAYERSPASAVAVSRAIELGLSYGAELNIVTAYEVPLEGFSYSPKIWESEVSKVKAAQAEIVEQVEQAGVRHFRTFLKHGKPSQEIVSLAAELDVGLIILGYKSNRMVKKAFLDNVVEKVIRSGNIAVWIAKA